MGAHQFNVGQLVRVRTRFLDRSGDGVYEVVRQLPATPNGDLHYRIKSSNGQERAVAETEIQLAGA
ncbi:MAG: hypothetical protein JWR08_309 [Enterovirga sp.]|jgi:hypothetical protein|nr:hypothetical protein [Enterovirga sp.]